MIMPLLKVIHANKEKLVVVCDSELLGKTFKKKHLRLEVKESFYCGKEASVRECLEALRSATIANLVGSIVNEAIKAGMIGESCVISFRGAPHAQLVRM